MGWTLSTGTCIILDGTNGQLFLDHFYDANITSGWICFSASVVTQGFIPFRRFRDFTDCVGLNAGALIVPHPIPSTVVHRVFVGARLEHVSFSHEEAQIIRTMDVLRSDFVRPLLYPSPTTPISVPSLLHFPTDDDDDDDLDAVAASELITGITDSTPGSPSAYFEDWTTASEVDEEIDILLDQRDNTPPPADILPPQSISDLRVPAIDRSRYALYACRSPSLDGFGPSGERSRSRSL